MQIQQGCRDGIADGARVRYAYGAGQFKYSSEFKGCAAHGTAGLRRVRATRGFTFVCQSLR